MNEQKQETNQQTQPVQVQEPVKQKKGKGFFRWLVRHPKVLVSFGLVLVIVVGAVVFYFNPPIRDKISINNDTSRLGFQNVGELATQSAYCTEISMTEADRELFGLHIPFTQSKYIYSYDVVMKGRYDFGKITSEVEKDAEKKIIQVHLRDPKII